MHGVIVPVVGELESQEDACATASSFLRQILTGARSIINGLLFWFLCWGLFEIVILGLLALEGTVTRVGFVAFVGFGGWSTGHR